jgi:uncharacterized protein YndB with AHSA1/START domain
VETIHIQSFVAAPPGAVWRELLGRPDIVLDALPVAAWPERREEVSSSRLKTPWPAVGGAAQTSVEITLDGISGGTRIDLLHDGWAEGPASADAFAGHFAGWLQAVAALGLLVESGKDARASTASLAARERYFASAEVPAGPDAVFRALTDEAVLARWSAGALDGAELADAVEGRYARWTLPAAGAGRELVAILRHTPRGTHCALAEYGVGDRSASARWPKMLERLAQFLR